jgi:hypothetical protein
VLYGACFCGTCRAPGVEKAEARSARARRFSSDNIFCKYPSTRCSVASTELHRCFALERMACLQTVGPTHNLARKLADLDRQLLQRVGQVNMLLECRWRTFKLFKRCIVFVHTCGGMLTRTLGAFRQWCAATNLPRPGKDFSAHLVPSTFLCLQLPHHQLRPHCHGLRLVHYHPLHDDIPMHADSRKLGPHCDRKMSRSMGSQSGSTRAMGRYRLCGTARAASLAEATEHPTCREGRAHWIVSLG